MGKLAGSSWPRLSRRTTAVSGGAASGGAAVSKSPLGSTLRHFTRPVGKSGVPLWTVVVAIVAAALMVDTGLSINTFTPARLHTAASPNNNQPLNVNTTLFYPYLVNPDLYPTPANLTLLNFSQPQLVSTVVGAQPTFFLLSTGSTTGNGSDLYLQEGYYEPSLARDILNGTHCPPGHGKGHGGNSCGPASPVPIQWSISSAVPGFTDAPIDGDALAVNNTTVVVAAATGGSTSLWLSPNAGENWSLLGSFSGEFPHLALSGSRILLTTNVSTGADATSLSLNGSYPTTTVPLNGAGQAVPVLLPNQTEVIAASFPAHASIAVLASANNGTTFIAHPVANYTNSSTSPIFNSIGGPVGATSLSVPGGIPGQVTATVTDGNLFLLYTTSVNGRMVGESLVSYNAGLNWSGPYFTAPSLGAIQDPVAVSCPEGYVYVTWRENGNGGWRLDQSAYGANGIAIQSPSPLPDGNGVAAGSPGLAIDSLLRPLYVWAANTSAGTQGLFTGDFLSLANASSVWEQGVGNLQPSEIVGGQTNLTSTLLSKLEALANKAGAGSPSGAIEKIEQDLYPKMTGLPLTLLCDGGNPVCGHVHKGANPAWIVNSTGVMAPQTYFAIYADWALESLGVGVLTPLPGDASNSVDGAALTVTTTVFDPTVAFFNTSYIFPAFSTIVTVPFVCVNQQTGRVEKVYLPTGNVSLVGKTGSTVGIDGSSFHPTMGTSATTFWATNMSANTQYSWSMTVTGYYQQTEDKIVSDPTATCGVSVDQVPIPKPTISPASISVPVSGSFATVMKMMPNPPYITSPAKGVVNLRWADTMPPALPFLSNTHVCLTGNGLTCNPFASPSGWEGCAEDCTYTGLVLGTYQASGVVQSWPGTPYYPLTNTYITPALSLGVNYGSNPPTLSDSFSCSIDLQPNPVKIWGEGVAGISASGAVVFWNSSVSTPSSLRYYAMGTGVNLTLGPTVLSTAANGSVEYETPLVALSTLSAYVGVISESKAGSGCLTYTSTATVRFGTPGVVSLHEGDLPYDSITKEGGGATISYTLPQYFGDHSQLVNGSLIVALPDGTQPTVLPGSAFTAGNYGYVSTAVSMLTPNNAYKMSALFNYSQGGTIIPVIGLTSKFVYLKDTSGDGLSDAEKVLGWGGHTANTNLYATNGLVSDYVEKEFGLNPNTLDSAGSHMLDTWNLTFTLPSVSCPSGFQCWDESGNSNWDPFGFAQTPQGTAPGNPSGNVPGNFTQGLAGFNGPDNSPWGSNQLWSYSDLQVLQGLISSENVEWLRGVLSNSPGVGPAITVWGKLSWGADPLTMSTPGDGIPDGVRVNPLHEEYLQIYVRASGLSSCGENLNQGAGYANQFFLNSSTGTAEFQGFSVSGFDTDSSCNHPTDGNGNPLPFNIYQYFLALPVDQDAQYQHLDIQLVANNSVSGQSPVPLQDLPIGNNCQSTLSVQVDMFNPPYVPFKPLDPSPEGGVCSSGSNPALTVFGATAVPAGVKSQTYLWLPDDNSTLSNLPQGLQRYTGEQDFFLVVANVTERPGMVTDTQPTLSSDPIPTPWSTSDTRTLNIPLTVGVPGSPTHAVVNFLIPRDQFLNSPFGQAVLQDRLVPGAGSLGGPLLSDISSSLLGGTTSQQQLECYFQTNAMASGTTATTCNGQPDAFSDVKVISVTPGSSCTTTGTCGGVPSNSGLESGSLAAPALQGVVALNMSFIDSQYNPTSVYLDALIAGLMDNGTGGINGTFRDVTNELPSLGLNSIVTNALANQVWDSGGVYGAPTSYAQPPPPPPPSCSGWGCVWNAVSGVVSTIVGTVVSVVAGVVWTAVEAATVFMDAMAQGLASVAEAAVAATETALAAVGQALEAVLQALLAYIVKEVTALLTAALSPITNAMDQYEKSLSTDLVNAANDLANGKSLTGDAAQFWSDASTSIFNFALGIAFTVTVAMTVMEVLSLGVSFLIPLLIGVVMGAAAGAIADKGGPSVLTDFESINPVSPQAANEWETILSTLTPVRTSEVRPDSSSAINTYLGAFAQLLGIGTTAAAATDILDAWDAGQFDADTGYYLNVAAVATGVIGLVLAGVAAYYSDLAGAVVSLFFDGASLMLDGLAIGPIGHQGLTLENDIVLGADAASLGLDLYVRATT